MKNCAFLLLLIGFSFQLSAKDPVIRLNLVDQINEVFLANVLLTDVQSNKRIGNTQSNGNFVYSLKTSESTIRFTLEGYQDTTITLRGKSREINIPLKPTVETTAKWESLLTIACDSLNQKFSTDYDSVARFNDGKNGSFISFLVKNIEYPIYAVENGIQGKVYISFIVTADGEIHCPKIIKGASPALNREAIRVIQKMPKWSPAQKNNQSIASKQSIPISFNLQ